MNPCNEKVCLCAGADGLDGKPWPHAGFWRSRDPVSCAQACCQVCNALFACYAFQHHEMAQHCLASLPFFLQGTAADLLILQI